MLSPAIRTPPADPTPPPQPVRDRQAGTNRDERVGVGERFVRGLRGHDVGGLAAEIAYRFLFAVFPFGLFVAALGAFVAGLLHVQNPAQDVIAGLGDNLPASIAETLRPELERLLASPRADLLSVGALAALWAATGGTNALVKGMHRAFDVEESRPFLVRYAVAIGLTLLAAIGLIASFVTIVGGAIATQQFADRLGVGAAAWSLIEALRWPAVFAVLILAVAILYRYAPCVVVPWRWLLAGALVFTLGWLLATAALGFYAANVADYGATYGSLGAVIVLMLWFYVTGALLLVGAELAAALARERSPDSIRRRREERVAAEQLGQLGDRAHERVRDMARKTG